MLGYSCAVFCIAPIDDTDFHIVMELAEKWVGLFRRHNDAKHNSAAHDQPSGTTCTDVLGAPFANGTTDGLRMFDFTQGETSLNLFWKTDSGILSVPTQEQVDSHAPKAILLYLGDITWPYACEAPSMPLQVFRIGSLVTVNTPIDMTQCASDRRLRKGDHRNLPRHW